MPQIHHRSGDMLLPCIPCLFRTRSKMDLGIHDQEQAGRHGVCSSTRECRKKGRLETSPLFSCILLMPSNDDVTHFHTATNITSREWLKVLASSFCPSSYVRMSSLVGTSSEDAQAKTYAHAATVTRAREEIKGCHQIRWADCLWNMHMIRVNHG
jgi:hypothetical protein